jgi:hypothetical protein
MANLSAAATTLHEHLSLRLDMQNV